MSNYFKRVMSQTQTHFWINNVTRQEAKMAIEHGATGCTQNPSYSYKMLVNPEEKDYARDILNEILKEESNDTEALIKLQRRLVGEVAKQFLPMYRKPVASLVI